MNSNSSPIDTNGMIPIDEVAVTKIDHRDEVLELVKRARNYLSSMSWCERILNGWMACSYGYIIGVFYFHITPSQHGVPRYVWIIVGDLPPAYLDISYCTNPTEVIDGYVCEMQEWVDRVLRGEPIDDSVIPVNVPPERKWAELLKSRLELIRDYFLTD